MKSPILVCIALVAPWGLHGVAQELMPVPLPQIVNDGRGKPAQLRIEPGKWYLLELSGVGKEESARVSGSYLVDEEGKVRLHFLGQVRIGGLTIQEAERAIEKHFKKGGHYSRPRVRLKPDRKR